MKKVFLFSLLLLLGLAGSQIFPNILSHDSLHFYSEVVKILTMIFLGFIMIHVGYEFEIDKSNMKEYGKDYLIAATAAAFPWVFCATYFIFVMHEPNAWFNIDNWKQSLLEARFASPTSAGILFSMLAAAGLSATWVFQKARVLAIFDDLDTVLFMIPLKMMMVGLKWQLGIIALILFVLLWLAWRYLHAINISSRWPHVLTYAALLTGFCELVYIISNRIDPAVPIHLEILLPAFVLGCMMARPKGEDPHIDDAIEGHQDGPPTPSEQHVSTIISACFMVMVGLSMPNIAEIMTSGHWPGWGMIAIHVLAITFVSNLGKMFPMFCYKDEAPWKERLALSVGMWPRGEVGAGVIVVSISYGITGAPITVAILSLALNLICTGFFIIIVKKLLAGSNAYQATPSLESSASQV